MLYSIECCKVALVIYFICSLLIKINAQNINTDRFQYLSPVPGSRLNSPETNIIIRFGDAFDNYNVENCLFVYGSNSGQHQGKILLAENGRTLIFQPQNPFSDGEIVTVELKENLKSVLNEQIPQLKYSFETSNVNLNKIIKSDPEKYLKFLNSEFDIEEKSSRHKKGNPLSIFNKKNYTIQQDSLPDDFPQIVVDSVDNPTPGFIFSSPFDYSSNTPGYIIITDNYGIPVFYRKMDAPIYDFKKVNDSTLVYFRFGWPTAYYMLNNSYEIIDSFRVRGYTTDLHDFLLLENKHSFLLSYDYEKVPMDTVVPGGDTNATVIGIILQELDEDKNVVFQWRSWDHYKITDATYDINLTASTVDYAHSNSIEIDYDGNILLSTRHMDEITKINRKTGEIMWRLGGEYCRNNQFTFLNDQIGFTHQHDVRRLPNGNITLFDNGNLHSPPFTRIAEYQVDENNKLVTLVWEYKNNPATFSAAMGNARRLYNHNTIIGWGYSFDASISEVRSDKTISFYLTFPNKEISYRAFKFPWKTKLFVAEPDSLSFGYVPIEDSLVKSLLITNNSEQEIEINGILNRDSAFCVNTPLPISIPAFDTASIRITFNPDTDRDYFDDLHLQWNRENERIAQVVPLFGTTDSAFIPTYVDVEWNNLDYSLSQNYPNPFNPSTTVAYSVSKTSFVTIRIYDILGREVATLVNEEKPAGSYEVEFSAKGGSASGGNAYNLSSGIYFYKLQAANYSSVKKMILMK